MRWGMAGASAPWGSGWVSSVIVIVFADGAFGNVKRIQKDNYGARHIAVELHNPDFVALACVVGHHAYAFGDALFEVILGIDVGANELFDGDLSVVVLVQSAEQLVHYFSGKLPVAPSVQEVGQLLQRHSSVSVHIDRRKF